MKGLAKLWNHSLSIPTSPDILRPMQIPIADFPLLSARDARLAAQRARLLATLVDLPVTRKNAFGRAVQEVAGNAVQHCGSGHIRFLIDTSCTPGIVEAVVTDAADGREQIQATLANSSGPDSGLLRASTAADHLILEAVTDSTKQLRIGMEISDQAADIGETDAADWSGILRTRRIQTALVSTQRRSRELERQLSNVQRQRQQLLAELDQSHSMNETLALLSLVASKTDNAVVIMDADGLITWVNDAFIRMTGHAVQDAAGARPDRLLAGPKTDRHSVRKIEQAFTIGHGVNVEFLQYRREGTTSWISLSLTPVHNDDGDVTRWIGIGADINKRKEAERALENARTAAETASQLKGEFLANISHEIRTPMNAIIGMTDLTLCTELDADQREYLSTVRQSAESLLELLNDVLDLSKIEAGRLEIEDTPFELRSSITTTLKPMKFVAEQQGLRLNINVETDVPEFIVGDALRLRQILVNLVGNAIKFTKVGQVDVNVQMQWAADNEVGLEFIVADSGIGIPASKLDRIFEAFSQADSSITRRFGGTGLGLTITSQLLHLMNGRIWVQSEFGKGSRFHFTLRCRVPDRVEQQRLSSVLTTVSATSTKWFESQTRPLNILVADDHPANRDLIGKILQKRGHVMHFANDGQEAVERWAKQQFDIILMDVQMPGMDGYQAARTIREVERERHTHVPIVAITAYAMQGQREECLSAGMDAYMSKPVKSLELVTLVESLSDNEVNVSVTSATSTAFVALQEPSDENESPTDVNESEMMPHDKTVAVSTSRFAEALKRLDHDEDLLREQMHFFLRDGPKLVTMVMAAIANNDAQNLQIAAHRLKNLCATFDDNQTATLCGKLESEGSTGDTSSSSKLGQRIAQQVERLLAAIRHYCGV